MSGKFWGTDSEEEEEEDFFSDSEEGEGDDEDAGNPSRWVQGAAYGSDDEEEKREVRAKHERINDTLEKQIESIRTKIEENDWNGIAKEFDEVSKTHQKWLAAWERNEKDGSAPLYIALLADLEDIHTERYGDNKYKKGLSKTNKKSLNTMQQKMRRNNAPFTAAIDQFRERKKLVEAGELDETELILEVTKDDPTANEPETPAEEEKKEKQWTPALVDEKLAKIISARGRKGYDRQTQISKLKKLLTVDARTPFQTGQIYMHIISIQFDASSIAAHMGTKIWKECIDYIIATMELVEKDSSVAKTKKRKDSAVPPVDISTSIYHFLERLEQEYFKSLQDIDPSKVSSYVKRMRDVPLLLDVTKKVQEFYSKWNDNQVIVKCTLILMKYQHQTIRLNEQGGEGSKLGDSICEGMPTCSEEEIERLAKICFKHGDERQKTHAMLYFITFLASNDKYAKARNFMLMSHIQESVSSADIETQILFNRSMAYLGVCAFREGNIVDCHNCLVDLYSSMKYKELLAQGTTRYSDKGAEQEKIESRRQMPYHTHINTEVLETFYFISAILLEVPNSAANAFDVKRKPVSRILKKYLEGSERQIFAGPPEAPRDFFVASAKALIRGDWKKSCKLLFGLSVWNYVADAERMKDMIRQKIKEQGLRTYLFTASSVYDSLSAERLSSLFDLESSLIHSIVCKMIISGDLAASWDQESSCVVMHRPDPSTLQNLSLQFAEKVGSLVENNERLFDSRAHAENQKKFRGAQQRSKASTKEVQQPKRQATRQN